MDKRQRAEIERLAAEALGDDEPDDEHGDGGEDESVFDLDDDLDIFDDSRESAE
jgi:hypothetical protein